MLIQGYEKYMLCCWFENLTCETSCSEFDICVMVGNALNELKHESVDVGNDMSENSSLLAHAKLLSKLVSELFWTMVGKPHDMGTRDAWAGSAGRATRGHKSTSASLFMIMTTLLIAKSIY